MPSRASLGHNVAAAVESPVHQIEIESGPFANRSTSPLTDWVPWVALLAPSRSTESSLCSHAGKKRWTALVMDKMQKRPFVPTEIHVGTVTDQAGVLGILSIQTTEGRLDVALDQHAADAIVSAIHTIRALLTENGGSAI